MNKPQYVIDSKKLQDLLFEYQKSFPVYFPVKTNDNRILVSLLNSLGSCFEVETASHLSELIKIGVSPDRIVFFSPYSNRNDIRKAVAYGINFFVVSSRDIVDYLETFGVPYDYLIRLREYSVSHSRKVFGVTEDKMKSLINSTAKGRFRGFSFYLSAEINNSINRIKMIDEAIRLFQRLNTDANIINIGGGIKASDGAAIIEYVNRHGNYSVIAEPGRYLVNPCIDLVATVLAVDGELSVAYLNTGIYNGLLDRVVKNRCFKIEPFHMDHDKRIVQYLLSGPTADQADIIGEYCLPELKAGDQLIIKECGAYSETLSTPFYGYNKTTIRIV